MTSRPLRCALCVALLVGSVPSVVTAQDAPDRLLSASLEELMELRVTSVARRSQLAEDAAAAIFVITQSDIRRAGVTSLPEVLRLVPGVQVAQLGASEWAVSIRGFNDHLANKLLVLVDGRSIYTRGFSGVFWDMQSMMVSDIDRIEVIRGPGGATWGANAVNGVINVITRPATDTQGFVGELSAGTFERDRVGVRYGGVVGQTAYRTFLQLSGHSRTQTVAVATGQPDPSQPSDQWRSLTTGARMDWTRGGDALTIGVDVHRARTRPGWTKLTSFDLADPVSTDGLTRGDSGSILGRWTRTRASGGVLQVQAFHMTTRMDESVIRTFEQTNDVDAQYQTTIGARQGVVFGGGYRHVDYDTTDTFTMHLGSARIGTLNLFFQDEIALRRDLALTLGSKIEHDTFGGWGQMPSARVLWKMSPRQRLWAAVSRARRTPALTERDFRFNIFVLPGPGLPIVVAPLGNPAFRTEQFVQTEAGYRLRVGENAVIESTVFTGSYSDLKSSEVGEPTFQATPTPHLLLGVLAGNHMHGRTSGFEVNGQWRPVPQWQLDASYTRFHFKGRVDPVSLDTMSAQSDGGAPAYQWQVRSTVSVNPKMQVGGWLSHVDRLRNFPTPAYTRLDARVEYKLSGHLTTAAVAQNLLSRYHAEFAQLSVVSRVPRSARVELRWTY